MEVKAIIAIKKVPFIIILFLLLNVGRHIALPVIVILRWYCDTSCGGEMCRTLVGLYNAADLIFVSVQAIMLTNTYCAHQDTTDTLAI